jgi:DNA-binding transcriptional regulator YiaG
MTDIPELTAAQLARAMPASVRRRLMDGRFESGADIAALRAFLGLTPEGLAGAFGVRVANVRAWEDGRRRPNGPARALLRIAARHPRVTLENVESAAEPGR